MESAEVSENQFSSPILEKRRFPINYPMLSVGICLAVYIFFLTFYTEILGLEDDLKDKVRFWLGVAMVVSLCAFVVIAMRALTFKELRDHTLIPQLTKIKNSLQILQHTEISRYLSDHGISATEEEIESLRKELTAGVQATDVLGVIKMLRELKIGRVSPFQMPEVRTEMVRLSESVVSLYQEKEKRETHIIAEIEKMTRVVQEQMKGEVSRVEHVWGMPDHIHAARVEIENTAKKLRARYHQGNLTLEDMRTLYKELTEKVIQPRQEIEEYISRDGGVITMRKRQ